MIHLNIDHQSSILKRRKYITYPFISNTKYTHTHRHLPTHKHSHTYRHRHTHTHTHTHNLSTGPHYSDTQGCSSAFTNNNKKHHPGNMAHTPPFQTNTNTNTNVNLKNRANSS